MQCHSSSLARETARAVTSLARATARSHTLASLLTLVAWLHGAPASAQAVDASVVPVLPWPGGSPLIVIDEPRSFAQNLSGLAYEPAVGAGAPVLWALQNIPARLLRLSPTGPKAGTPQDQGRALRYPSGRGSPDAEGIALLPDPGGVRFVYVASETTNEDITTTRLSVLRYDTRAAGASLSATHEWNLTRDLPVVPGNRGLEGLAFVPDAELASVFHDESTQGAYAPSRYGEHAGGVFFVGVEQTGQIHGFVLDHTSGAATRIASIDSGLAGVMALEYDAEAHRLWAYCDNTCGNRAVLLRIASDGSARFVPERIITRPTDMPNINNEGITFAPDAACRDGVKPFFWATDGALDGHAVRRGTIACQGL